MSRMLGSLLQKAQGIKENASKVKKEMAEQMVELQRDGVAKVTASCDKQVQNIAISPTLIEDETLRTKVEEAILEAVKATLDEAGKRQKEIAEKAMKSAGISIPGLF